jgi:hypothetical protein
VRRGVPIEDGGTHKCKMKCRRADSAPRTASKPVGTEHGRARMGRRARVIAQQHWGRAARHRRTFVLHANRIWSTKRQNRLGWDRLNDRHALACGGW